MATNKETKIYDKMKCPTCGCTSGYKVLFDGDKELDYNFEIARVICSRCHTKYLVKGDH